MASIWPSSRNDCSQFAVLCSPFAVNRSSGEQHISHMSRMLPFVSSRMCTMLYRYHEPQTVKREL